MEEPASSATLASVTPASATEDSSTTAASASAPEAAAAASTTTMTTSEAAGASASSSVDGATAPAGPLSKRGAKRLARQEMWQAKKAQRKADRKAARQQRLRERREQEANDDGGDDDAQPNGQRRRRRDDRPLEELTPEEQEEVRQRREERAAQRAELREGFLRLCGQGARIVIDGGFDAQLTEKELKSLSQQLMHLYASNKRAPAPSTVYLTDLGPKLDKKLESVTGIHEWLAFHLEKRSYLDLFPQEAAQGKLIYLTSDSEDTLTEWDRSAVYIIGGIVDRNRLKGATKKKADEQGLRTARFPLQEHVTLGASKVLTVNHVFDILIEYQHSGDWLQSFLKVLPMRKRPQAVTHAPAAASASATAAAGQGTEKAEGEAVAAEGGKEEQEDGETKEVPMEQSN